ncbi:MAG: radical SAM protein [Candidatus Sumerlaeota bacterium]|nr:radical SAM protein [Candidatus Sumerlaeota bacterium]
MERHTRPFALREFKIEVTYRCDLNCVHCSSDARPSNPLEMSLDDCVGILRQAGKMGAKEVAFSGGEPLGWQPLSDAAAVAVEQGFRTTIYSSGNTVDVAGKLRALRRIGVDRFAFSLFGGTAVAHERITRTAGSFAATKAAIREAKRIGLSVELHFVPMSTNYREIRAIAALATECGAERVSVLRLVPQGRAALLLGRVLNRVQNLELKRTILELGQSGLQIRVGSPYNFLMLNDKPGCWAAIDRLIIGPDLKVYPCDAFKRIDSRELVGTDAWSNLSDSSLEDCWNRSPYLEAVRTYLTTDFATPCRSCGFLEKCLSGCLAQKAVMEGCLKKRPDPDCFGPSSRGVAA